MKKLDVLVRDKNTIVLNEKAEPGDYIDLTQISNLELTHIEHLIESGKDEVYNKKLNEYQKAYEKLQNEAKTALKIQFEKEELEKLNRKDIEINQLLNKIKSLEEAEKERIEHEKLLIESKYNNSEIIKVDNVSFISPVNKIILSCSNLENIS